MKKSMKITVLIVLIAVIAFAGLFHTDIYVRCYPKDRIVGQYTVMLDGKPVDYTVRYCSDDRETENLCGENGKFSIKGGEYGGYTVILSPTKESEKNLPDIKLEIFSHNWWNIISFALTCDVNGNGKKRSIDAVLQCSYYTADAALRTEKLEKHTTESVTKEKRTTILLPIDA